MKEIPGFGLRLQQAKNKGFETGTLAARAAQRTDLVLSGPEKTVVRALDLLAVVWREYFDSGQLTTEVDTELRRRSNLMTDSHTHVSARAKINQLVQLVKNG